MKLHILPLFAAGLLATTAAVSCSEDPAWTDASSTQVNKYSFFHSSRSFSFTDAQPLQEVKVTLMRGTSVGDAKVPVKLLNDTLKSTSLSAPHVHFANGSTTAEYVVKVNPALISVGKYAVDTLVLDSTNVSVGGHAQLLLQIEHKK
jgi:lipoprotein